MAERKHADADDDLWKQNTDGQRFESGDFVTRFLPAFVAFGGKIVAKACDSEADFWSWDFFVTGSTPLFSTVVISRINGP